MRLIDAEELTKILKSLFFKGQLHHHYDAEKCAYNDALSNAIERIRNAPTIDPAKHGHWGNHYMNIVCSKCGASYSEEITFMSRNLEFGFPKHCPNCGARMDGEEHDDPG